MVVKPHACSNSWNSLFATTARPSLQSNASLNLTSLVLNGTGPLLSLPDQVVLEIVEADLVVKGQTAASSYKPAVMENGVRVMVPPFISAGEKILVDTNEITYIRRAD